MGNMASLINTISLDRLLEPGIRQLAKEHGVHEVQVRKSTCSENLLVTLYHRNYKNRTFKITRKMVEDDQYNLINEKILHNCHILLGTEPYDKGVGNPDNFQYIIDREVEKLNGK